MPQTRSLIMILLDPSQTANSPAPASPVSHSCITQGAPLLLLETMIHELHNCQPVCVHSKHQHPHRSLRLRPRPSGCPSLVLPPVSLHARLPLPNSRRPLSSRACAVVPTGHAMTASPVSEPSSTFSHPVQRLSSLHRRAQQASADRTHLPGSPEPSSSDAPRRA